MYAIYTTNVLASIMMIAQELMSCTPLLYLFLQSTLKHNQPMGTKNHFLGTRLLFISVKNSVF